MQKYNEIDFNIVLQKAEDLKTLFHTDKDLIDFLDEMFVFLKNIPPLLLEINYSISENLKKMPGAADQLKLVTQANEVATTEIMDITDKISNTVNSIINNLEEINKEEKETNQVYINFLNSLITDIQKQENLDPKILRNIEEMLQKSSSEFLKQQERNEDKNKSLLQSINNNSFEIINLLQVQDITSQQIAAVNHTLKTIQQRLLQILVHFENAGIHELEESLKGHNSDLNVTSMHREISFDASAINNIGDSVSKQNSVDEIFGNSNNLNNQDEVIDIDSLFK